MKKHICILGILFFSAIKLIAQDSLILIDKSIIECKTIVVKSTEVEYTKWGTSGENSYAIKKSLVYMIKYNSGEKDTITPIEIHSHTAPASKKIRDLGGNSSDSSTYIQGYTDGFEMQDGMVPGIVGGISAVGCGLCGIVTPIVISTSKVPYSKIPKEINKSKSNEYQNGFIDGATKKRSRAVWIGYAVGWVLPTAIFFIYLIAQ